MAEFTHLLTLLDTRRDERAVAWMTGRQHAVKLDNDDDTVNVCFQSAPGDAATFLFTSRYSDATLRHVVRVIVARLALASGMQRALQFQTSRVLGHVSA